jgi:transcriptional regulator with XRE-family HTH domain
MTNNAGYALGKEIRRQRRLAGLSQKEVAARVGVTGVQFHRYEVGATGVTTSRLVDIAKAIGVRPDVLLNAATSSSAMSAPMDHGANLSGDVATFLEMFMAIKDQDHRNSLMAVARMMSSTFLQASAASANTLHDLDKANNGIAA